MEEHFHYEYTNYRRYGRSIYGDISSDDDEELVRSSSNPSSDDQDLYMTRLDLQGEIETMTSGYDFFEVCDDDDDEPFAKESDFLATLLEKLPAANAQFAVPLRHKKYTTKALSHSGTRALQGDDQVLSCRIGDIEGWSVLIAECKRTILEEGCLEDGDRFYVNHTKHRQTVFGELFNEDGSDASAHREWLSCQRCLDPIACDGGGIMMASEEDVEQMWRDGRRGKVKDTI